MMFGPSGWNGAAEPVFPSNGSWPLVEDRPIGFVGTYPPTKCGIATFTAALSQAIAPAGSGYRPIVVRCVDRPGAAPQLDEVAAELVRGSSASRKAAAAALAGVDVVVLQHEFGIFGGEDGSEVIDFVAQLTVPVIAVLHTVPRRPTHGQRAEIGRAHVLTPVTATSRMPSSA